MRNKNGFSQQSTLRSVLVSTVPLVFALVACTAERTQQVSNREALRELAAINTKIATAADSCSQEEVAAFDQAEGEFIDLEREVLPKGIFLATNSEMLLDKKSDDVPVRMLVREVPGANTSREIVCSENTARLVNSLVNSPGNPFEMNITGVVKFDTSINPQGDGFTLRQFYAFSDKGELAVVVSTPKISAQGMSLKQALSGTAVGQIFKTGERAYLMRFTREKDGVRARIMVRMEFIPQP